MAKMLLVAVEALDSVSNNAYCDADHEGFCQDELKQILSIWEGAKRQCA